MPHSVVYNDKPIEELEKPELIAAIEAVCGQLENCKQAAAWYKKKYEEAIGAKSRT